MEEENLDYKTVFTIKHSEIPKGVTQCKMEDHKFEKASDNEVYCPVCNTALIVSPDYLNDLLNK
jgi:hypothetical protein